MRLSLIVAPRVGRISGGTFQNAAKARTLISDRIANGEAFGGEFVARLPRRLTRTSAQRWAVDHRRMTEA